MKLSGVDIGGGLLTPPSKVFVYQDRDTLIEQSQYENSIKAVCSKLCKDFMYFISNKRQGGEVGSYFQQAVNFFFWSHLQTM